MDTPISETSSKLSDLNYTTFLIILKFLLILFLFLLYITIIFLKMESEYEEKIINKILKEDRMNHIMITAHSGCDGTPENSLAFIEKGIALGVDCVEIDLRLDQDGKLWLSHEIPQNFSGLTSLEEAFALIQKSGIAVNCDLKEYEALKPALDLAKKYNIGSDQLIFSGSVDTKLLEKEPEITLRSKIFLNSEELVKDLIKRELPDREHQTAFLMENASLAAKRLHALGATALNAPYKYTPDELISKMRAKNVELSLWTINEEEPLREFMKKDLMNITTRNVSMALKIRNEIK